MKIGNDGYVYLNALRHPFAKCGYVPEHRLVMESEIGRFIDPKIEQVHHRDKNRSNNEIENLLLVLTIDHGKVDRGWVKKNGEWYKPCSSCRKFLKACRDNFYPRRVEQGWDNYCILCRSLHNAVDHQRRVSARALAK